MHALYNRYFNAQMYILLVMFHKYLFKLMLFLRERQRDRGRLRERHRCMLGSSRINFFVYYINNEVRNGLCQCHAMQMILTWKQDLASS